MNGWVLLLLALAGCGIKGPPRPPTQTTAQEPFDAGCDSCPTR